MPNKFNLNLKPLFPTFRLQKQEVKRHHHETLRQNSNPRFILQNKWLISIKKSACSRDWSRIKKDTTKHNM